MTDTKRPEPPGSEVRGEPSQTAQFVRLGLIVAGIVVLGARFGALPMVIIVAALLVMIFMHELGHYLTARWAGMKVTEFFLGFGPRLWSVRRGETEYGIKAIPAGAYVRIIGMSNLEEVEPADESRTYRQKPYWRRLSVAVAGSTMHFLMAIALLFVVFAGFGIPDGSGERWTIESISKLETGEAPAAEAGLRPGDRILSADGRTFETYSDLRDYLRDKPGDDVTFVVERDGERLELTATLADVNPDGESVGFLGIAPQADVIRKNVLDAGVDSITETGRTIGLSVKALGAFFTPSNLGDFFDNAVNRDQVAGDGGGSDDDGRVISVVGAVQIGSQAAEKGVADALYFLFVINIFVGVFNLVPLLPLDGGHVAIATYERIRSRKGKRYYADVAKLLPVTYAVIMIMLVVGVTAIYLDVADPVTLQ